MTHTPVIIQVDQSHCNWNDKYVLVSRLAGRFAPAKKMKQNENLQICNSIVQRLRDQTKHGI